LIVRDLASGPRRFVELQRVLPGISTEQLRSRLNRMVADGMLTRKRYREVPPRVDYELTERARELMPVLGALARWGYHWAWSEPRASEAIDVGAIFRLAPGLLEHSPLEGTLELVIADRDLAYLVTLAGGNVEIAEREADGRRRTDARVTGSTQAWIAAFSPNHDRGQLEMSGDTQLADSVLDALSADGHLAAAAGHGSAVA
jgi:DNA-binding HxlR family transcriptional regulator